MKTTVLRLAAILAAAASLSSCGLAGGMAKSLGRLLQSAGRTTGLGG